MKNKLTTKDMIQSMIDQKKNQLLGNKQMLNDIDNQIRLINYSNLTIEADIATLEYILNGKQVAVKRKYVKVGNPGPVVEKKKKRKTVLSPETLAMRKSTMKEVAAIMREGFSRKDAWKQMQIRRSNFEGKLPEPAQELINTADLETKQ